MAFRTSLEGRSNPIPYSTLLKDRKLRYLGSNQDVNFDFYVTVQVWANSKPLGVEVQTSYKHFKNSKTWNEWLELPVTIKDIPQSAQLAVTVWDLSPLEEDGSEGHHVPFGGTTVPLFETDGTLAKGRQKCKLYRHRAADGLASTTTPFVPTPKRRRRGQIASEPTPEERELERIEKLFKKHEMGEIPRVDWLDQLVFRAVEKKKEEADISAKKKATMAKAAKSEKMAAMKPKIGIVNGQQQALSDDSDSEGEMDTEQTFNIYIEFPRFDFPVVFADHEYPPPKIMNTHSISASGSLKPPAPEVRFGPGIAGPNGLEEDDDSRVIRIYDPEQFQRDNPCETKHRRLVRSNRNGIMDQDQKPNAKLRDELNEIMSYGPTHELNGEEKDLVWRFRRHLSKDKRALTKFVKSTNWQDVSEARQAVELIPRWAEIDVDDALELLGPTFDNPVVRAYAVDRLRKADDDELLLYLLQLVQALKFDRNPADEEDGDAQDSFLAAFLVERASNNFLLGNFLHWYLMVECDDRSSDTNPAHRKLFAKVEYNFMLALEQDHPDIRKTLLRQGELITVLSKIGKDIRFARENRTHKIERLKKYLADPKNELLTISPPLPLPLDPTIQITGIDPSNASVFKSSLSPLLINFKTLDNKKYSCIFKSGDDLRQDQLVIQIISLMDRLLRKENLDLKLTPYAILATAPLAGAVQYIPSTSLSAASAKYKGSILAFLRHHNPDDKEPLGVRKETMDTYIKSCAGYCVITYILGVGDRHLENLLLAPSGHFFHIDFGFILGRDPKPFAPMMKLCKEMIEPMGGTNSPLYLQFKQYCYTTYTTLRKNSNLILNLFSLMVDANVPDIRLEPEKAVLKIRDRLHLDVTEVSEK